MIWNTLYHISFNGPEELKDSVLPVLNELNASLSVFDEGSLVSRLNRSDSIVADRHLVKVYCKSKEINKISRGMFDPTVSPLIDAWGFGIGHTPSADTLAIDSILQFVGIYKTSSAGEIIYKKDKRIRFNFSAIAKGYGCDQVGEMFRRNGVEDYMVEIGGEIALSGKSPSGNDWKISIDAPVEGVNPGQESALVISVTDVGIATSGNYRNFRRENGVTLGHTISPLNGRPFISEILSTTVVASNSMEADALATACMASAEKEALDILADAGAEGLLILTDTVVMTPGFEKFISATSEPGRKDRN